MPTLQAAEESMSKEVSGVSKVVNEAKEKHGSSACLKSLQRKRKKYQNNKNRKTKIHKKNEQSSIKITQVDLDCFDDSGEEFVLSDECKLYCFI